MPSTKWRSRTKGSPEQIGKAFKTSGSKVKGVQKSQSYIPKVVPLDQFFTEKAEVEKVEPKAEPPSNKFPSASDSKEEFLKQDLANAKVGELKFLKQLMKVKPNQSKDYYRNVSTWRTNFDELRLEVKGG